VLAIRALARCVAIRATTIEPTSSHGVARAVALPSSLSSRVVGASSEMALTLGLRDLLCFHMTVILLAVAAVVSLGVVAMCRVCRDR
jgi:hypothetical protein